MPHPTKTNQKRVWAEVVIHSYVYKVASSVRIPLSPFPRFPVPPFISPIIPRSTLGDPMHDLWVWCVFPSFIGSRAPHHHYHTTKTPHDSFDPNQAENPAYTPPNPEPNSPNFPRSPPPSLLHPNAQMPRRKTART